MCCSLENRAKRLDVGLKKAQEIARTAPPDLPDADELEEMDDSDRERLEQMLEAISLAGNAEDVRAEIAELKQLAVQAKAVETTGAEAKLSRLKNLMQEQGFFDHSDQRLLIFTEFKDTLDYLVAKLVEWGFLVGCIHGSMRIGSRDDPGSRLHTEQQFREAAIQILVATEAAGEGINLQCCNILFNYDIPWNPNRLEQRMGRIHRYGQKKNCLIFNFVATNTIEGKVLQRLLEKLQEIRNALNDDAVFNVVGEVLPAAQIERVLRDYYAGHLGDADLEDRLLHNVDEGRFRAICQNALEGLASKRLNLEMLIERRAKAQERRVIPETIARFLAEAAGFLGLALKAVPSLPHTYDPGKTPSVLKNYERNPDWRLPSQRSLTLQSVERITSILILPHPDRSSPEVRRLRPNPVTEATAMRVVMEYERSQGRQVFDVSEKNLGYDITSLDINSGDLRLIEVKGIGDSDGSVLLTPNERRVAEDRRDCYWLYVVTHCNTTPQLREPIRDPARLKWVEVTKVAHYRFDTQGMK